MPLFGAQHRAPVLYHVARIVLIGRPATLHQCARRLAAQALAPACGGTMQHRHHVLPRLDCWSRHTHNRDPKSSSRHSVCDHGVQPGTGRLVKVGVMPASGTPSRAEGGSAGAGAGPLADQAAETFRLLLLGAYVCSCGQVRHQLHAQMLSSHPFAKAAALVHCMAAACAAPECMVEQLFAVHNQAQ